LGAAAQAAALLSGEAAELVARRWDTQRGIQIEAVPRDSETVDRLQRARRVMFPDL
jgi:xylulokinase